MTYDQIVSLVAELGGLVLPEGIVWTWAELTQASATHLAAVLAVAGVDHRGPCPLDEGGYSVRFRV